MIPAGNIWPICSGVPGSTPMLSPGTERGSHPVQLYSSGQSHLLSKTATVLLVHHVSHTLLTQIQLCVVSVFNQ